MDRQPAPPPVTVTRTDEVVAGSAEVLAGTAERRPWPRPGLQAVRALLAAVAVLVASAGVVAADRERRLAGEVALTLLPAGSVEQQVVWELTGRTALVRYRADLRNDGPRPVSVERAALGALRASPTPQPLAPGARVTLPLTRVVRCVDPQDDPVPEALSVELTTGSGSRTARLPVDAGLRGQVDAAADRACGVLPLREALELRATSVTRVDGAVVVGIEAANRSTRPLRLVRIVVLQGLRGEVSGPAGEPLALPLDLPPAALGGRPTPVPLRLTVTVVRCAAIAQLTPAPPGQLRLDTLSAAVDGGGGLLVGPVLLDLNDRALRVLVEQAC